MARLVAGLWPLLLVGALGCSLDRSGVGVPGRADAGGEPDALLLDGGAEEDDAALERDADARADAFAGHDAGLCHGDDADGDGVADACDRCPGADDRNDGDSDAVPDACDAWPCGLSPPVIPDTVSAERITISRVWIDDGGNTAVVVAGTDFDLDFRYEIGDDPDCGGCNNQIEIGLDPGDRIACAYDANSPGGGASGVASETITAPTTPGLYALRFNLGERQSCHRDGATTWFDAPPPAEQTLGALCVVP